MQNKKDDLQPSFINGGLKGARLEILADKVYAAILNPTNNILFEEIRLYLAA